MAQAVTPTRPMGEIVAEVTGRLVAQDCPAAVTALKQGLKSLYPEVALLAGSMYENGLCQKRDWSKAVIFYTQAYEGDLAEAADRLAAGFAYPANGLDVAAALWWALRGSSPRLEGCTVSAEAEKDPERFVAELNAWPQRMLATCNYVIGVLSAVSSEVKYPRSLGGKGVDVVLRFFPEAPRIELETGEAAVARVLGQTAGDKPRQRIDQRDASRFEAMVRSAVDIALRRYPQPRGVPPGSEIAMIYRFPVQ